MAARYLATRFGQGNGLQRASALFPPPVLGKEFCRLKNRNIAESPPRLCVLPGNIRQFDLEGINDFQGIGDRRRLPEREGGHMQLANR